MKKLLVVSLFYLSISINSLFAITFNDVEKFADDVSHTIFNIACPTAIYQDTEVVDYYHGSSNYTIVLNFKGKSHICKPGSCPVWFMLKVTTDSRYMIKNMKVLGHNITTQPPFETTNSVADAIIQVNKD